MVAPRTTSFLLSVPGHFNDLVSGPARDCCPDSYIGPRLPYDLHLYHHRPNIQSRSAQPPTPRPTHYVASRCCLTRSRPYSRPPSSIRVRQVWDQVRRTLWEIYETSRRFFEGSSWANDLYRSLRLIPQATIADLQQEQCILKMAIRVVLPWIGYIHLTVEARPMCMVDECLIGLERRLD